MSTAEAGTFDKIKEHINSTGDESRLSALVKYLNMETITESNVNEKLGAVGTIMHVLARYGNEEQVTLAIKKGGDLKQEDENGMNVNDVYHEYNLKVPEALRGNVKSVDRPVAPLVTPRIPGGGGPGRGA